MDDLAKLTKAVESLILSLPDNEDDYPDLALYRQISDKVEAVQKVLNDVNNRAEDN